MSCWSVLTCPHSIGAAVQVIQAKLSEDDSLAERTPLSPDRVAELLDVYLRSTYFNYGGEFYKQREGVAMGSSVSEVVEWVWGPLVVCSR